jgi:large-conductance mechanosensitive channel
MFETVANYDEFKNFLIDNRIITTLVGVIIAYSAWELIQSFVGDIILPTIYFLFLQRITNKNASNIFEPMNKLNIPNFIKELVSFIIVLMITFFMIFELMKNLLGNEVTEQDKEEKERKKMKGVIKPVLK